MRPLKNEQKQLLFDYSLGLTTEGETAQAKALITSKKEADEIHSRIKATLAPLDSIQPEPCPDELAERVVRRLCQLVNSMRTAKQAEIPVAKVRLWPNFVKIGAIAASILIIVGVLFPTFSLARHRYWKHVCQEQLGSIYKSIDHYSSDHDGKLPAVATKVGESWCGVGYQGKENLSNTRNPFLLLKNGYSGRPEDFVCCSKRQKQYTPLKMSQVHSYNDFPSRRHITYSPRIFCRQPVKISSLGRQPLMADCNPVFETMRRYDKLDVCLDRELSIRNSINHNRRGQNVLSCDGNVRFLKTRHVGVPQDDIFTVQNVDVYRGSERPACETDPFLAP
jgi:hypothetical protein